MNITGIIKDAFTYPSKKLGNYVIYLILSILMAGFAIWGYITYTFGFFNPEDYLFGGIFLIIAMMICFIIYGYRLKVIKSGIELDDNVPGFVWYDDFMSGFDNFVVTLFYYLIPALIVIVIGIGTNLVGNAVAIAVEVITQIVNVYIVGASADVAVNAIALTLTNFLNSLIITLTAALILFIIFTILKFAAQARLANTGSLKAGLNIFEAIKDILSVGIGKVIALIILFVIIFGIIGFIIITLLGVSPLLSIILGILLVPYLILVAERAIGLTYSDIA